MSSSILAIDTSGPAGSVAVSQGGVLRSENFFNSGARHAERLITSIDHALSDAAVSLEQVDVFAVTRGPGSFTGVRVGMAAAKGLALALNKPLLGFSSLQVLAMNAAACDGQICALLDARKKEVYAGFFRMRQGRIHADGAERVASPAEVVDGVREPTLFVGEGALVYRELIESTLGTQARFLEGPDNLPRAAMLGLLASANREELQCDGARLLSPEYLRASEAEISWQKRRNEETLQG